MIDHREPIGGLDENGNPRIVEIDESKYGKKKYNKVKNRFAVSSLPAKQKHYGRTDGPTDTLLELWLTTKKIFLL